MVSMQVKLSMHLLGLLIHMITCFQNVSMIDYATASSMMPLYCRHLGRVLGLSFLIIRAKALRYVGSKPLSYSLVEYLTLKLW